MPDLDLTFAQISLGTHQAVWDLRVLLFKGAARIRRNLVMEAINEGKCGNIIEERLPFVLRLHEVFNVFFAKGNSVYTVINNLEVLWRFYIWIDNNSMSITTETVIDTFKDWTEYLLARVKNEKNISSRTAYKEASKMAKLIAKALDIQGLHPGKNILLSTRMRLPLKKKKVLSTKDSREKLSETFEFGNTLTKVCNSLDVQTIRGKLPINIEINEKKSLIIACGLRTPDKDSSKIRSKNDIKKFEKARRPLLDSENVLESYKRSPLVNFRIESELLIFIAQTGMNLTQATGLEKESYRWKSDGDSFEVFRVYKGRRGGEAVFRCFNAYREHLQRYLIWLDDIGFSSFDNRLFPHLSRSIIPSKDFRRRFINSKEIFKKNGLTFFSPQELRNTRINWLLRHTRDVDLTADLMGHTTEVLLRNYEKPHHQRAGIEIVQFHNAIDTNFSSPGPGVCVDLSHKPETMNEFPKNAPKPDCISPEGCLFCTKHRDVMTSDYCWKLASHAYIKKLETNLYKPSEEYQVHPAYSVINIIFQKLNAISESSKVRAIWVKDANDSVRAGRYHPNWDGYIQLLEVIV